MTTVSVTVTLFPMFCLFLSPGQEKNIDEALFNDCVCAARYEVQRDFGTRTGRDLVSVCLPGRLEVPGLVDQGRVVATLDKKAVRKIVHATWIDFEPERCMQMLSDLQRVLGRWQCSVCFSVGIGDCLVDMVSYLMSFIDFLLLLSSHRSKAGLTTHHGSPKSPPSPLCAMPLLPE